MKSMMYHAITMLAVLLLDTDARADERGAQDRESKAAILKQLCDDRQLTHLIEFAIINNDLLRSEDCRAISVFTQQIIDETMNYAKKQKKCFFIENRDYPRLSFHVMSTNSKDIHREVLFVGDKLYATKSKAIVMRKQMAIVTETLALDQRGALLDSVILSNCEMIDFEINYIESSMIFS
jgi:hypothetical protein